MKKLYFLFVFIISINSTSCLSLINSELSIQFNKYKSSSLSPYQSPLDIYKSLNGELWLLFEHQLVITSGKSHITFNYNNISHSNISSSSSPKIAETEKGIYISIGHELFFYEQYTNKFIQLKIKLHKTDTILSLDKDKRGNLWAVSFDKIILIKTLSIFEYFIIPDKYNMNNQIPITIIAAVISSDADIYLATYNSGVIHFNESKGFSLINHLDSKITQANMLLSENKLLLNKSEGLFIIDLGSRSIKQLTDNKNFQSLKMDNNRNIYLTSKREVWKLNNNFENITRLNLKQITLKNSHVIHINNLFIDNENIIWLTIKDEGIFTYHPYRNKLVKSSISITQTINNQYFETLSELGYIAGNRDSTFISKLNLKIERPLYSHMRIDNSHYFGAKGDIIYIDKNNKLSQIKYSKGSVYPSEKIIGLLNDFKGRAWVLSKRTGLNVVKFNKKQFTISNKNINIPVKIRLKTKFINYLTDRKIIISTRNNLYVYDANIEQLKTLYSFKNTKIDILKFDYVDNELYLYSSNNTIYIFNFITNTMSELTLPINNIGCVLRSGEFWFIAQTRGSLFKWNDKQLIKYDHSDGLPGGGLNGINCFKKDGTLYFSAFDGIYSYHASNDHINKIKPNIILTSVKYSHSIYSPKFPLDRLTIQNSELPIAFNLASSSYIAESNNQYQYRFKNKKTPWIDISSITKQVLFDGLSPNHYILEFRVSNNDGIWSSPKEFELTVLPPLWLSLWAKTGYFLLFILFVYLYFSRKLVKSRRREIELENQVNNRTEALNKEKLIVEKLLSKKNQEFENISHELKTPLTLILGPISEIIHNQKYKGEHTRLLLIQKNANRLLRMVEQLLNIEIHQIQENSKKIILPVGKIIRTLSEAFHEVAKEKGISLKIVHIDDVNFEMNNNALEQIILNILSNAIKYSKKGSIVTVKSIRIENDLRIQISDTGIGIPQSQLPHIFKRYKRIINNNNENITGTGIGLALVKTIIESHGGSISIISKLGEGTEVSITLPILGEVESISENKTINEDMLSLEIMEVAHQEKINETTKKDSLMKVDTKKHIVLIIEDNIDMQNYIKSSLSTQYTILTASNGEQGLIIALKEIPDIIICDIMMPKLNGYQTTQALKTNNITNHIPIILLTAKNSSDSRIKGWEKKADEYLTKPFNLHELKIRMNNLLEIRQILKKHFSNSIFQNTQLKADKPHINNHNTDNSIHENFILLLNNAINSLYTTPETSILDIAKSVAMSERQFFRKIKNILDMTPADYLRSYRLNKAKDLLLEGKTANYTAFEVGFSSQSYFGKCFKAQFGVSPRDFKKSFL